MQGLAGRYVPRSISLAAPVPPGGAAAAIPATTAHIVPPAPFAPTPSLIPGPFILLLLLPSIPLLLFSLGARPPDTSHLPFSTGDIFATTAFILVAGSVVLCLGVYPEVGGAVADWVRHGGSDWDWGVEHGSMGGVGQSWQGAFPWPWAGWSSHEAGVALKSGSDMRGGSQAINRLSSGRQGGQLGAVAPTKVEWKYDLDVRRWVKVASRPALHIPPTSRGVHSLASKHLTALRDAYPKYYSTHKPPLIASLLIIAFFTFLLTLLVGKILGDSYDNDKSSSSSSGSGSGSGSSSKSKLPSWVERELRKRKEEKPGESKKRMKAEEKKELDAAKKKGKDELKKFQKKREEEKMVLGKELKKRKMSVEGLEDIVKAMEKAKKADRKDGDESKETAADKDKGKAGDKEKKQDEDAGDEEGTGKESKTKKLKRILLGEKGKKKEDEGDGATKGPGWEIADPGLAQVTLAKSGHDAQKAAERLKAGG